ncbi:MAG: inorganic diphosphatase [Myxococcota bacterium]
MNVSPHALLPYQIEIPRGGFVKRDPDGQWEFLSPLPCPFNYGSIPGVQSADGEPMDVVVLGPSLPYGAQGSAPLRGRVRFLDAGVQDDKWVLSTAPLHPHDACQLRAFFSTYALVKAAAPWRRIQGATRVEGLALFF